jgi:hypothetical protein
MITVKVQTLPALYSQRQTVIITDEARHTLWQGPLSTELSDFIGHRPLSYWRAVVNRVRGGISFTLQTEVERQPW